jgi:protein-disulfide isomerase
LAHLRSFAALLLVALTIGCKAQTQAPAPGGALDRRIEVLVRSQYGLPPDVIVTFGARTPSQFTGYKTLPVSVSRGGQSQQISFLISDDNTKLIHLDTMDLTKNPGDNIDIAGRPIRGNADATITVINFDDLQCPYCAHMHEVLFPETFNRYQGKVRFIYKDDPLTEIHPWAMRAAIDANCLAAQNPNVYWTYVDYLHAHGDEVNGPERDLNKSNEALDRIARQEGTVNKLDSSKLEACLAKQDKTAIEASRKEAANLQIDGTPALFVDGERINGAVPKQQLWAAIDRALLAHGIQPPPAAVANPVATPQANAPAAAGK